MLAALTILNWYGADRCWPGALNLYLPQAIWAVPGLALTVFFLKTNRPQLWLPLLCLIWVFGPLMGYCWSPQAAGPTRSHKAGPSQEQPDPLNLRVMTWNIKYGFHDLAPLLEEMARCEPDVVLFQDAGGSLRGPLANCFRNWQVRCHGQYVIASKYPLSQIESREIPSIGERQEFLRCRLQLGGRVVSLYNVHLKTPRDSLNAFRTARSHPWYLPRAIERFTDNVAIRLLQADIIGSAVSQEQGPVLVAGDLNAPDASLACETLREAGLHDAFAERGRGYGFTYGHFLLKNRLPWLKISWMRIDHIMVSAHFETRRCWAGTGRASDHRPVIADLTLRRP